MILVDRKVGSRELLPIITRAPLKLTAQLADLEFADFAFEGQGKDGFILVGIERKTLGDMMRCIDDSRYAGHQRVGMAQMYQASYLVVEGTWRPHDETGVLMEQYKNGFWGESRAGGAKSSYSKLRRYLFSVAHTGVHVLYTRDMAHTARDIHELWHYYQKPWHKHTSMLEIYKQPIAALTNAPSVCRQWAQALSGVGAKHGEMAERHFRRPLRLATAEVSEWLRIPGIGYKTANQIVKEIMG